MDNKFTLKYRDDTGRGEWVVECNEGHTWSFYSKEQMVNTIKESPRYYSCNCKRMPVKLIKKRDFLNELKKI